jgi:eukaryotic-like serine/threonine-protein kinase
MTSALSTGTVIGPYQLLTPLGRGGAATVWAARQDGSLATLPPLVALKVLNRETSDDASFRARFLQEAALLSGIRHPNVVGVFHSGQAISGELFTAMEWVYGESLHRLIAAANRRRPVPSEIAAQLVAEVADGLEAVHQAKAPNGSPMAVVHCDVSPQNILIGVDGSVRLVDFGVASTEYQRLSPDNKLRGKPGYMSPEQTLRIPIDRRSDLFSLGIVLFELSTGRRLFRGTNQAETIRQVRECAIPLPRELEPELPLPLQSVILKALQRDPSQRFQSAAEFRDAIHSYLKQERIIVPRAGIRSILKRVVGHDIAALEQRVRGCILALDG